MVAVAFFVEVIVCVLSLRLSDISMIAAYVLTMSEKVKHTELPRNRHNSTAKILLHDHCEHVERAVNSIHR